MVTQSFETIEECIEGEIVDLREELEKREKQRQRFMALSNDRRLAEELHETLCHHNHAEGCSWFYGSWETPSDAHNTWLNKAKKVIVVANERNIDPFDLLEVFKIIK